MLALSAQFRSQRYTVLGTNESSLYSAKRLDVLIITTNNEGLPGVLGNKGTLPKYRREQGNISQFLGTGEQNSKKLQYENILRECGNMGT